MLSKKSPQNSCGIRNRNERIQADEFLNQGCGCALDLESMLLTDPAKIPFSTASTHLCHRGSIPERVYGIFASVTRS
jgi:hypothetical protein